MKRARILLALAVLGLAAAALCAQSWSGPAALAIEVKGKQRGDIAEALVILRYQLIDPPAGPRPVRTDAAGRAVVAGLAPGIWEVEVSHPEYLSFVSLVVIEQGRKPRVQASFLQASGSSLTPIKVRFLDGKNKSPSPSVPLPPEAAERLARRRPPPVAPTPSEVPRESPAPRSQPQVMPPQELRPLPQSARPSEAEDPGPAPAPVTPPDPAAPAGPGPEVAAPAPEPPPPDTEPAPATPEPGSELSQSEPEPAPVAPEPEPSAAATAPETPAVAAPPSPPPAESDAEPSPAATEPETPTVAAPAPPRAAPEPEQPPAAPEPKPEPPARAPEPPEPLPAPEPPVEPPVTPEPRPVPAPVEAEPGPLPEPAPPPVETPPEPPAAASEPPPEPLRPAPVSAAPGPLGPTLRAYRDQSCIECRPGEWALSVEVVAGPGSAPCPPSAEADGAALAGLLGGSIQLELAEVAAPAGAALAYLEAPAAEQAAALLGDASHACRILAAVLPKGGRFRGARLEAADASGVGDCQANSPCPVGRARWLGQPRVAREPSATVIWSLFANQAPDRARRARLTVYFASPSRLWEPRGR